jgi:succinyl-CoA synthetase beta subunit
MDLLEIEGKVILREHGMNVPLGRSCSDLDQLRECLGAGTFPMVIKAQVTTGGRGKAGGIAIVNDAQTGYDEGERILSMSIKGKKVGSLLVEPLVPSESELYVSISYDPTSGMPLLLVSPKGGMDVESVPVTDILRQSIDPLYGLADYMVRRSVKFLDLARIESRFADFIGSLWELFWAKDLELLEVNPLILTPSGDLVAVDVKMSVNDDSIYRHPGLGLDPNRERTAYERRARELGLVGVEMEGSVGVLANGAGLTMSVMDALGDHGLRAGAFLDLGGTDDPSKVGEAVGLLFDRGLLPNIKGIMICVFGGITRCDTVAEGLIKEMKNKSPDIPVVVRLRGIMEENALGLLIENGLHAHRNVDEACLTLKDRMEGS